MEPLWALSRRHCPFLDCPRLPATAHGPRCKTLTTEALAAVNGLGDVSGDLALVALDWSNRILRAESRIVDYCVRRRWSIGKVEDSLELITIAVT